MNGFRLLEFILVLLVKVADLLVRYLDLATQFLHDQFVDPDVQADLFAHLRLIDLVFLEQLVQGHPGRQLGLHRLQNIRDLLFGRRHLLYADFLVEKRPDNELIDDASPDFDFGLFEAFRGNLAFEHRQLFLHIRIELILVSFTPSTSTAIPDATPPFWIYQAGEAEGATGDVAAVAAGAASVTGAGAMTG